MQFAILNMLRCDVSVLPKFEVIVSVPQTAKASDASLSGSVSAR